jgi:hypothetical protein
MGGTGVFGSPSGKAAGFDPGGLLHFTANQAAAHSKTASRTWSQKACSGLIKVVFAKDHGS